MERNGKAKMFLVINLLVAMLVAYCFSTGCSTGSGGGLFTPHGDTPVDNHEIVLLTVKDANGNPIKGATCIAYLWKDFVGLDSQNEYYQSITDDDGASNMYLNKYQKTIIAVFQQTTRNNNGLGLYIYDPTEGIVPTVTPGLMVYGEITNIENEIVGGGELIITVDSVNTDLRTPTPIFTVAIVPINEHGYYCTGQLGPSSNYGYTVQNPTNNFGGTITTTYYNPQRINISQIPQPVPTSMIGNLNGTVRNSGGQPIYNVQIDLYNQSRWYQTYSDPTGSYRINDIQAGIYELRAISSGYHNYSTTVNIRGGQTTTTDIDMTYYNPTPIPTSSPGPSPTSSPYRWVARESNTSGNLRTIFYNSQTGHHAYGGTYVRKPSSSSPWAMHTATPLPDDSMSTSPYGSTGHIVSGQSNGLGVIVTTNDGSNYTPIPMPTSFPSPIATISIIEDTHYWDDTGILTAVGTSTDGYQVAAQYNNTNQTWSPIFTSNSYPGSFSNVYYNGVYGVIAGYVYSSGSYYPDIRYTDNGGSTWDYSSICADGKINSICYSGSAWYAVGTGNNGYGFLYKTSSLSSPWQQQTVATNPPPFNGVYFTNTQTGFIAAGNGKIFQTTNGGSAWAVQNLSPATSADINCVYFPNSPSGWAVGNNGVIYEYSNQ